MLLFAWLKYCSSLVSTNDNDQEKQQQSPHHQPNTKGRATARRKQNVQEDICENEINQLENSQTKVNRKLESYVLEALWVSMPVWQ